jgi:hypothetical protein
MLNYHWHKGKSISLYSGLGISYIDGQHIIRTFDKSFFFLVTPGPTYTFPFHNSYWDFTAFGISTSERKNLGFFAELGTGGAGNFRMGMLIRL